MQQHEVFINWVDAPQLAVRGQEGTTRDGGHLFEVNVRLVDKSVFHLKKAEKLYTKLENYVHAARARQMLAKL